MVLAKPSQEAPDQPTGRVTGYSDISDDAGFVKCVFEFFSLLFSLF
jgi:hypothetical protein